ncbi:MAG: PKD domain-containing protein, partial [Bacteroidetes bacterium]|nr:PKD domain-containing protein [Bacteroidota bacterium]
MKSVLLIVLTFFFSRCIFAQGEISYNYDVNQGCAPLTVTFLNTSTIDTTGVTFYWDFNDGNSWVGFDTVHTFVWQGYFLVHLSAHDSLGNFLGEVNHEFFVWHSPEMGMSPSGEACPGEQISFGIDNVWWAAWDFGDGGTSDEQYTGYTYNTPGTYYVTVYFEGECGADSITKQIEISLSAVPDFNIGTNGSGSYCPGDNVIFSVYGDNYSNLVWDFGDGEFAYDNYTTQHSYSSTGTYEVILTLTNMCGNTGADTINIEITNDAETYAGFGMWSNPACPGDKVYFNAYGVGHYEWDFGDGTTMSGYDPYPVHIYPDTGTYAVTLIITNACGSSDTNTQEVVIEYQPWNAPYAEIRFNVDGWEDEDTITICPGSWIEFRNNTMCNGFCYYYWSFGDGNTSEEYEPYYTYTSVGIYTVSLIAMNSCGGADTAYLYVIADNTVMPNSDLNCLPDTICPGEYVYFYDENGEEGYVYSIWFGDGDSIVSFTEPQDTVIEVQASHLYDAAGVYQAIFTVTNQC